MSSGGFTLLCRCYPLSLSAVVVLIVTANLFFVALVALIVADNVFFGMVLIVLNHHFFMDDVVTLRMVLQHGDIHLSIGQINVEG